MLNAFINNAEIDVDLLHYDEWVYLKYNPDLEVYHFKLIIDYDEFEKRLQSKYREFIQEMVDDDHNTNENFFFDLYKRVDYPLFEEIITDAENNYKMDFLNSFFIKDILLAFTSQKKASNEKDEWIIREVISVNNDKKNIYINGMAQLVIRILSPNND